MEGRCPGWSTVLKSGMQRNFCGVGSCTRTDGRTGSIPHPPSTNLKTRRVQKGQVNNKTYQTMLHHMTTH
eukprot:108984-Amphidinium_carterae.1